MTTHADHRAARSSAPPGASPADVLDRRRDDRRRARRPGRPTALGIAADTVDRRHRQVRRARRRRRAHAHGDAVRRHRGVATRSRPAPSPRRGAASPRSSTSPCRTPAASVQDGARRRGTSKADGNCAIDYGFHQIIGGVDEESLKAMTLPRRQRGHHQLQAVHGLPGRALLRRRPDPAGDADGRRVRGDDHDARRERHRHRRARRPGARPRRDRPEVPRLHPAAPSSRARPPTGRSSWPRSPATCRCTSCTCRRRRRSRRSPRPATPGQQRVRRDVPAVPLPVARGPARPARLRGRQVGVLDAAALASTSTTSADLWKGLRMNELAVVSTDHCPFCMKEQKELGIGNFAKIPNGIGGVEHRMELLYQGVVERRALARALGRDVLHHAGADVRAVPEEGRHRPRRRRRHPRVGPATGTRRSASTRSTT